jgi:hypothetical protein
MLIELRQSELAQRLTVAGAAIVDLLVVIAAASAEADYEEATAAWPQELKPDKEAVEAVLELSQDERKALLEAVRNDIAFEANIDCHEFGFVFSSLDKTTRDAGKKLLVSMYEEIFAKKNGGFELESGERANRKTWEQAFREANPDVRLCPACLISQLLEPIKERSAVDADHYLPKSRYPPLAVHGLNLVPICSACNRTGKANTDPLHFGDGGGLPDIWFPYRRFGLGESTLRFDLAEERDVVVKLEGLPGAERRAELYDDLFEMSGRWSRDLDTIHRTILADLSEPPVPPEAAPIRERLNRFAAIYDSLLTRVPNAYLSSRYARWLAEDDAAMGTLIAARAAAEAAPEPVN